MVKTVSLENTMKTMQKELSRRVLNSGVDKSAKISFRGAEEAVTLEISGGKVALSNAKETKNVIAAGHHSARLLIGSEDPAEMIAMKDISVKGDGGLWAEILFPNVKPTLAPIDHY